jgi:PAS domain-containing protein
MRSGGVTGFASNVTKLKRRESELAESQARFRALSETSRVGIWRIDEDGQPIYANPSG